MYSFASHGYGSDRIFLSISGLVKKYTHHCFCNPSKTEVLKSKDLNALQVIHVHYENWVKTSKENLILIATRSFSNYGNLPWSDLVYCGLIRQRLVQKLFVRLLEKHYGSVLWQEQIPTTRKFQTRTYAFVRWPCRWRFGTWYYYLRQAVYVGRIVTKNLNKSASIKSF